MDELSLEDSDLVAHHEDLRMLLAVEIGEALSADFHGAYVNYIDPLQRDWATAYYGENLTRLRTIKTAADPDGFFRFQQSVDSAFEPAQRRPLDPSPINRTIC